MRSAISARSRAGFDKLSMSGVGPDMTLDVYSGGRLVLSLSKDGRVHRPDRVPRPALAPGQELVEDAPLGEQPAPVDLAQLVLVDPEGTHLEALARPVVGHLEPLRAGPRAVARDADRGV